MDKTVYKDPRSMDLIIKPTEACNFKCTFCSSPHLVEDKAMRLHLETIYEFLERFPNTNTIIVNGGDPTMMPVKYYWDLIKHVEDNNYRCNISLTTNLWVFYLEHKNNHKTKKWTELFKYGYENNILNVTTSFNYGDTRRITDDRIFTEQDFVRISDLMLEHVGYRPHFISVIDESNLDTAVDNVRLAKYLGVDCKLNYANASGWQSSPLPLSKIYEIYIQIWKEGLADHEWNTRQMANRLSTLTTTCPLHRKCDDGIRVLHPDGKYYSCGAIADDHEYEIDYEKEVKQGQFFTPLQDAPELHALKHECYSCEMFQICNGCRKHIRDLKKHDMVEVHCTKMKSIAKDILDINEEKDKPAVFNETYYEVMKDV